MAHLSVKRKLLLRTSILQKYLTRLWRQILARRVHKSAKYRQLPRTTSAASAVIPPAVSLPRDAAVECSFSASASDPPRFDLDKDASDLVALKISLLGDNQIGKTSFLTKYVGKEKGKAGISRNGLNQMDKTINVKGAQISYNIWEVEGTDFSSQYHIRAACKDSVAMLFMFDLTSRCTLNSILGWFQQARRWNQAAIPVMIGTKFDDFVELPLDLQWTIASEARAYAKALNATLFFSSATYNINVNKIFKFVTAKLFNLPWKVERNLTVGEPMIDY
ncbi:PREDICTED: septum-promoting GTP-binding protein 1-like [Ipomoea nil]|uniref:septum-promoting GTP-binding protein 1-like n=1 Tax=Ipomoea nil TaxID=35883 RepID=UPI0009016D1D|nr:PREDICTED: septum-promoting GTP-binding protein 1-like [Ipomoea nil]XP_019159055.1 PREDICTED: septum-promoting GTP-binding protein 1-like [Ipomoea nil]